MNIRGGGDRFSFFGKIDMKGPYLANIGKKNQVLEKAKFVISKSMRFF